MRIFKLLICLYLLSACSPEVSSTFQITAQTARIDSEEYAKRRVFKLIKEATIDGECHIFKSIGNLPIINKEELEKLGYKVEFFHNNKWVEISWCN